MSELTKGITKKKPEDTFVWGVKVNDETTDVSQVFQEFRDRNQELLYTNIDMTVRPSKRKTDESVVEVPKPKK